MAIPAKRFEILTNETNLGINDFLEKKSSSILNLASDGLLEITEQIQGFSDAAIQDPIYIDNLMSQAAQFAKTLDAAPATETRTTKDLLGTAKDLAKLTSKQLDKTLGSLLPNSPGQATNLFGGLSILCKTNSFGFGGLGKPFDLTINCNGNSRTSGSNCNNGQFSSILSKLTGGSYNSTFEDLNEILKNIMSLSLYGYSLNMCGVFNALTEGVTNKPVLNRAAAGIGTALATKGNSLGMFDLTSTVAALGLKPILEAPSLVNKFLTNFKIPLGTKETDYTAIGDRMLASSEIIKPDWKISDEDAIARLEEASMGYNPQLNDVMESKRLDNTFTQDDLNYIPSDDQTFLSTAYTTSEYTNSDFYM